MQHRDIIDLWGDLPAFVKEVGLGGKYFTARGWHQRNSIPAEKWVAVVKAAAKRGFPVSYEVLALGAQNKKKVLSTPVRAFSPSEAAE